MERGGGGGGKRGALTAANINIKLYYKYSTFTVVLLSALIY